YPILYISEPGFWAPSEKEMEAFRTYLLKGGFAIFDDFSGLDLDYVLELLARMLPGLRPLPLTGAEPVFDSFFTIDIATLAVDSYGGGIRWYGIFEENDRSRRMMAILAGNGDIGEAWEFSDTGWVPIYISNNAYKLGVNFIVYAMTPPRPAAEPRTRGGKATVGMKAEGGPAPEAAGDLPPGGRLAGGRRRVPAGAPQAIHRQGGVVGQGLAPPLGGGNCILIGVPG